MSVLKILIYPDENLFKSAKKVEKFDQEIENLVRDLADTMYSTPDGVGLAATQVNVQKRVLVLDLSPDRSQLQVFINPELIEASAILHKYREGCLSVPDVYEEVNRPQTVRVRAQDLKGDFFELSAEGLLAVCLQHEIDHLDGKIFVEKLSPFKQFRVLQKLKKQQAKAEVVA